MKALVIGRGASGKAAAARLAEDGAEVAFADGVDLVVASPGVRVMSELEYGVRRLTRLGTKMLAVTGSKGKSSVVKLVAEALGGVACGNYGLPASEVPEGTKWAVVEVSSFQLETTNLPPDAFEAAAILNLQEDHLDRHGGVEAYHAIKRRLLGMAKRKLDPEALVALAGTEGVRRLMAGSYFDRGVLRPNGAAAVALLRAAGLEDAAIRRAFLEFAPLPHRMQLVGEFGGARCVDDSKATSLAAMAAAIGMVGAAKSVRLIAGGLPKGDDPKSVVGDLTRCVQKVYLIGKSAEAFFAAWKGSVDCEICGTLERAVESAMREAERGETVLLSPGTASFDQFKSFEERGEVFARLVKAEGQKR